MTENKTPQNGDLKVWWIPQVPMTSFNIDVENIVEAKLLLETLADYDIFQYENKVKPDYSNMGGVMVYDGQEWVDLYLNDLLLVVKNKVSVYNRLDDWLKKNEDDEHMHETLDDLSLEQVRSLWAFMTKRSNKT